MLLFFYSMFEFRLCVDSPRFACYNITSWTGEIILEYRMKIYVLTQFIEEGRITYKDKLYIV